MRVGVEDRADLFRSALRQIAAASVEDLRRPLQVSFVSEAAEDAGGPRREFFNDFGRAMAESGLWMETKGLRPVGGDLEVYRGCGRIFGLALCQAENAAQEQRVRENATIQELLAAVTDEEQKVQQKLLVGAELSRAFLRCVQRDEPESLAELQDVLNAETEEPDFRGSMAFLSSTLDEMGLEGQLTFSLDGVELRPGGKDIVVTDQNKLEWLKAVLRMQLVDSMQDFHSNLSRNSDHMLRPWC